MRGVKARVYVEVSIHLLFWVGVSFALKSLTVANFKMVGVSATTTMGMDGHSMFPYRWVVLGILMLQFYGNILWLFPRMIREKSRVLGVALILAWTTALFFVDDRVIRALIGPANNRPPSNGAENLSSAFRFMRTQPFSQNDWAGMQLVMAAIFISMLGIAVAYFFIKEWIGNDLRRSQAEAQQLSTEIRFLRSQVNPHFLFNTLNNLFSMAQSKGHEELADSISRLSDMMRYMIYESNTDMVSLQREITYLEDCIALNKLRYADSEVAVCFRRPAPEVAAGVTVTPMLFIPFLENAFKHGVSIGRHSRIDVDISVEQKKLIFSCVNTDHSGIQKLEEEKGGIGLENVRRRLELLYPGRHELKAGAEEGDYFVKLQIELA